MSEKIKQFSTKMLCECVGHPTTNQANSRIICKKSLEIIISNAHNDNRKWKEVTTALDEYGWKRLKTLGHFQNMCPRCTKVILGKRKIHKDRWG